MSLSPMYILAFIFLLSTSLLFLLWHCRNAILARIIPQDEFDVEIGRAIHLPGEIYSGSFHSTSAAPALVISRLPVFRYPGKAAEVEAEASDAAAAEVGDEPGAGSSSSGVCDNDSCGPAAAAKIIAGEEAAFKDKGGTQGAGAEQQQDTGVLAATDQDVQQQQQQQASKDSRSSWITQLIASSQQQQLQRQQLLQQQVDSAPPSSSSSSSREASRERALGDCRHSCSSSNSSSSSHAEDLQQQPDQQEQQKQQQQQQGEGDDVSSVHEDACIICFSDYVPGDLLKELPCKHYYHASCIDQWLTRSGNCPLCKMAVWQPCASRSASNDSNPQQ